MKRYRWLNVVVLLVLLTPLVSGCAKAPVVVEKEKIVVQTVEVMVTPTTLPPTPTPLMEPHHGGTLTFGRSSDFQGLDPHVHRMSNFPLTLVFNGLVRLGPDLVPKPDLAESWDVSDDSRTVTLHLRQGVKFHNGKEFTAEDVAVTIEHMKVVAQVSTLVAPIESVEVQDDYTAILHLSDVYTALWYALSLTFICDKDVIDELATNPVGTGPFKLGEWLPGDKATFVRFDDYWEEGLPYLDEVIVPAFADTQSLMASFEAGAVDIMDRPEYIELPRMEKDPKVVIERNVGFGGYAIYINVNAPPFDNKLVRQAMGYAFDRDRFVQTVLNGAGEPWTLPFPKTSWAYDPEIAASAGYDIEKAKALLEEAGYGDGFEFTALFLSGADMQGGAEILQAELSPLNIKMRIELTEQVEFWDRVRNDDRRDFHLFISAFGKANNDPASLAGTGAYRPGTGHSRFTSEEYERLLKEGSSTLDLEKRKGIYRDLSRLLLDEAFVVPVAGMEWSWALHPYVHDMQFTLDNRVNFQYIWLSK